MQAQALQRGEIQQGFEKLRVRLPAVAVFARQRQGMGQGRVVGERLRVGGGQHHQKSLEQRMGNRQALARAGHEVLFTGLGEIEFVLGAEFGAEGELPQVFRVFRLRQGASSRTRRARRKRVCNASSSAASASSQRS